MSSHKKDRAVNHQNKGKTTAAVRGHIRRKHFDDGGSTDEWSGRHVVHDSLKRNDRRTVMNRAIDDSFGIYDDDTDNGDDTDDDTDDGL